jgi:hypothetical protein
MEATNKQVLPSTVSLAVRSQNLVAVRSQNLAGQLNQQLAEMNDGHVS